MCCAHLLNPLNALPAQLGRHSHLHCTRFSHIRFPHCSPSCCHCCRSCCCCSYGFYCCLLVLHITFCLAFLSCANHARCPRHGQCLPPSSCCCCCCCFRPCTGSDTRTGVWARKRVLYLSYLPFSPLTSCCCCCCGVVFLAVTLVLIALAVPARLGSGSATRTAMIMLQTCRINRAGERCVCVARLHLHKCSVFNVYVCVCE